ncbi:MAG TPA: DUF4172 domain-containing protein [Hymenobacter sp.]
MGTVRHQQGRLLGRLDGLGLDLRAEATLQTRTLDVVKSSEIEDELLPPASVRSSLAHRLGLEQGGLPPGGRGGSHDAGCYPAGGAAPDRATFVQLAPCLVSYRA